MAFYAVFSCLSQPLYVGRFRGDGSGLTNLPSSGSGAGFTNTAATNLALGTFVNTNQVLYYGTNYGFLRLTNETGVGVNILSLGAVANSLAASNVNMLVLSNAAAAGGIYFVPSTFYHSPFTILTNAPRSKFYGYGIGGGSKLNSTGATNTYGIRAYQYAPTFVGITFDYSQNVPQAVITNWAWTEQAYPEAGGGLWINAIGPGQVENCEFIGIAGNAAYFQGYRDISARSNELKFANCIVRGCYNGFMGARTNGTEFVSGRACYFWTNTSVALYTSDANNHWTDCHFMGWIDGPGGSPSGVIYKNTFKYRTCVGGRTHSEYRRMIIVHGGQGVDIDGVQPDGSNLGAAFKFEDCQVGGCISNYIGNFLEMSLRSTVLDGGTTTNWTLFPASSTVITNVTQLEMDGCYIQQSGLVHNGAGAPPFWLGRVTYAGGESTNNYLGTYQRGGVIGRATFRSAWADLSIGAAPTAVISAAAGGSVSGGFQTEGMSYANGFMGSNYLGFINKAYFRPADDTDSFDVNGHNMQLWNWSRNVRVNLSLQNLSATGNLNVTSNATFTGSQTNKAEVVFQGSVTNGQTKISSNTVVTIGAGAFGNIGGVVSSNGAVTTTGNAIVGNYMIASGGIGLGTAGASINLSRNLGAEGSGVISLGYDGGSTMTKFKVAATNVQFAGLVEMTNGIATFGTNQTIVATSAGVTNTLSVNYIVKGLTGVSVVESNWNGTIGISRGTLTVPTDIVLKPGAKVIGSSIAVQGGEVQ